MLNSISPIIYIHSSYARALKWCALYRCHHRGNTLTLQSVILLCPVNRRLMLAFLRSGLFCNLFRQGRRVPARPKREREREREIIRNGTP
jgi:hypothetical protein